MSFFRSAQPIWGPGKSTNKTKKIGSEAVFSEMTQTTSLTPKQTGHRKKTGHKEPKQAKQRTKQTRSKPLVKSWRRGVRARGPPLWREGRARRHFGGGPSVNPSRVRLTHMPHLRSRRLDRTGLRTPEAAVPGMHGHSEATGRSSDSEKEDLQIFGLPTACRCGPPGILTAIAEIWQEAVFKSTHPWADGSLIRAVRLAVSAEKAYDAPKKTDARKIIALGQALLRAAGLAFNSHAGQQNA